MEIFTFHTNLALELSFFILDLEEAFCLTVEEKSSRMQRAASLRITPFLPLHRGHF